MWGQNYKIQSGLNWKEIQEEEERHLKEQKRREKEEREQEQADIEFLECMEGV